MALEQKRLTKEGAIVPFTKELSPRMEDWLKFHNKHRSRLEGLTLQELHKEVRNSLKQIVGIWTDLTNIMIEIQSKIFLNKEPFLSDFEKLVETFAKEEGRQRSETEKWQNVAINQNLLKHLFAAVEKDMEKGVAITLLEIKNIIRGDLKEIFETLSSQKRINKKLVLSEMKQLTEGIDYCLNRLHED